MKILPTKFPRYTVSDTGVVFRDGKALKSHNRGKVVKKNTSRYQAVNISIYDSNGKFAKQIKYYVHRLVAEAFIENPNNLSDIDHIDENKENNHVSNLRWYSRAQNMERNALPEGARTNRKGSIYEKKDGEWVLIPKERIPWNKGKTFKMPEGYQAWNKGKKSGAPDGTVRKRMNGHYSVKEGGKWHHLRQEDYPKYGIDPK